MADSILRLRVESSEYDAKLSKAVQGLQHLAEVAHRSDGEMTGLNQSEVEFIRELGDMETKSRTAAGGVRELENSFKELSVIYNNLNEEEKKDEGGKALAASLEQLKQRAQEARAKLDEASRSLQDNGNSAKNSGGMLDALASKFTLNIDALKVFNAGLSVVNSALDVAKDAFFQSESNIDEWGRTVKSAEGAYDVFLNTLNTGNWSDFFSNLQTAVQGARDLYDALDRLGSVKSNNQAAIAIQQQQVQQLRLMKQQGKDVDDQLKAATERLAYLQRQAVSAGKVAGSKTMFNTISNYVNAANENGVSISDDRIRMVVAALQRGGQDVFDKYKSEYTSLGAKATDTRTISRTNQYGQDISYQENFTNLSKLTAEEQRRYLVAKAVTERETEIEKGLSIYAQAVQEGAASAREEFKGNRYILQKAPGSGGGSSPQEQAQKSVESALAKYESAISLAAQELEAGTITDADYKKQILSQQQKLYDAYGSAYQTYSDPKYKDAQDQAAAEIIRLGGEVKTTSDTQKQLQEATKQLEQAEKKRAEGLAKLKTEGVTAVRNNDLGAALQVQKKAIQGGFNGSVEIPLTFTYTDSNMAALIGELKSQLKDADFGSEVYDNIQERLSDATAISSLLQLALENGIAATDLESISQDLFAQLLNGENIDDETIESLRQSIVKGIKKNVKVSEKGGVTTDDKGSFKELTTDIHTVTSGLSSVASGLNSLGVEIPSGVEKVIGVVNGVMQVITGISQIISVFQTTSTNANTVALDLNTAALYANSAAQGLSAGASAASGGAMVGAVGGMAAGSAAGPIGMAIGLGVGLLAGSLLFANGGIVPRAANGYLIPGNSFSGDTTPVLANAGEVILSRSQQNALVNQMPSNDAGASMQPFVNGEQIFIGMNNTSKRMGRGEIVTTGMLKRFGLL